MRSGGTTTRLVHALEISVGTRLEARQTLPDTPGPTGRLPQFVELRVLRHQRAPDLYRRGRNQPVERITMCPIEQSGPGGNLTAQRRRDSLLICDQTLDVWSDFRPPPESRLLRDFIGAYGAQVYEVALLDCRSGRFAQSAGVHKGPHPRMRVEEDGTQSARSQSASSSSDILSSKSGTLDTKSLSVPN